MANADSNAEIFARLNEMRETLARIDERTKAYAMQNDDHEKRIRTLEDKEARRGGVIAALTTIGSAIGAGLTWLVHHFIGGGGS